MSRRTMSVPKATQRKRSTLCHAMKLSLDLNTKIQPRRHSYEEHCCKRNLLLRRELQCRYWSSTAYVAWTINFSSSITPLRFHANSASHWYPIELLQNLLHFLILLFDNHQRVFDSGQAQFLIGFVGHSSLILLLSVMLDLLATLLDLWET
jgi:hypothetical protein